MISMNTMKKAELTTLINKRSQGGQRPVRRSTTNRRSTNRRLTRQQANVIMKAALAALIETNKERRIAYGLPRTMDTEDIREVFQCLPEFDKEYHDARNVITNAARLLGK